MEWNLFKLLNFIESWSATQEYKKEKGQNPVDLIIEELNRLWGKAEKINTLRWPLFLKISRL